MTAPELVAAAKEYHEKGFAILPFIINPANGKKEPDTKAVPLWHQWQTQPQTNAEFEALHIENYSMFGVICGTPLMIDGEKVYFIGIDRDVKDPKISEETKQLTQNALNDMTPYTQREKTRSGGDHLGYYSRIQNKGKKFNDIGMELLGIGNLMVMAPSEGYTKVNDNTISTVENAGEIFYKALRDNGLLKTDSTGAIVTKKQITTPALMRPCFEQLIKKYHLEHAEKVALIYEMHYCGMSKEQIFDVFMQHQAWEPAPEHTFDEDKTRSQVVYTVDKASEGNYRYKKDTLINENICLKNNCPYSALKDCRRLHPTIEELVQKDPQIAKIKDGDFDDYPTAEDAFVSFVLTLYDYDFSVREVKDALDKLKITRWISATDAFREKIFKKADKLEEQTSQPEQTSDDKRSQADRLIDYCLQETTEFFKDQHQTAYVRIKKPFNIAAIAANSTSRLRSVQPNYIFPENKNSITPPQDNTPKTAQPAQAAQPPESCYILVKVRSQPFKEWLSGVLYRREQKGANNDALNSVTNYASGKCREEGKTYELYNRVAPDPSGDGSIWLDMSNENWQAIHITKTGWKIVNDPPILFYRFKHQKPLLIPQQPQNLEQAREYANKFFSHTNVKNSAESKDNQLLVLCTIISYIIPIIPHPNIIAYGEQGACKSYCFKLIRRLIDPASLELLDIPSDKTELIQKLYHNWLCFFDNLTYLSTEYSDLFCRVITGAGFSKRELFSDDEDIIYQFVRCLSLNGINQVAKKGDLIDRSLPIIFEKIEKRKIESEVDADFYKDAPFILGGMLTVLSEGMNRFESVQIKDLQRLADFHKWGCAIAEALGKTSEEFTKAYEVEVNNQVEETINAEPVGIALLKFLEKTPSFNGTATELLEQLKTAAIDSKINTALRSWPQDGSHLSKKINEIKPALNKKGYEVISKNGTPRKIIIAKNGQITLGDPPKPTEQKGTKEHIDRVFKTIFDMALQNDGLVAKDKIVDKEVLAALLKEGRLCELGTNHEFVGVA